MDVFGRPPTRAETVAGFVLLLLVTVLTALMLWSITIVWSICESESEWNHNKPRSSISNSSSSSNSITVERLERTKNDYKQSEFRSGPYNEGGQEHSGN